MLASATFYDSNMHAYVRVNRPCLDSKYHGNIGKKSIEGHCFTVEVYKELNASSCSYTIISCSNAHGWLEPKSLKQTKLTKALIGIYWQKVAKGIKSFVQKAKKQQLKDVNDHLRLLDMVKVNKL